MTEISPSARLVLEGLREVLADPAIAREIRATLDLEPTPASPTLYTAETLAAELGVHPRTIRRHIASGDLRASKRGDRWVITAEAAREWAGSGPGPARPKLQGRSTRRNVTNALASGFQKAA